MKTIQYSDELFGANYNGENKICISIIIPLYKQLPERNQNKLMVKNAVKEAKSLLKTKYNKNDTTELVNSLNQIQTNQILASGSDGVGIFISNTVNRVIHFPFEVKRKVIIDFSFEVRDLIFAQSRLPEYFVLALDNNKTRLFIAKGQSFEEIINESFPLSYEEQFQYPDRQKPRASSSFGREESIIQEERQKGFYRHLDKLLAPYFKNTSFPIVLLGIADQQALFKKMTRYGDGIAIGLKGNFAYFSSNEIFKKVWPEIIRLMRQKDNEIIVRLEKLMTTNKIVTGIQQVWKAINDKTNKTLVVEKDYNQTGYVNQRSKALSLDIQDSEDWNMVPDLVDDIIELAIDNQRKVIFVENGNLEKFNKIALIDS